MIVFWKVMGNLLAFMMYTDILRFTFREIRSNYCFGSPIAIMSEIVLYVLWIGGTVAFTYAIWMA